MKWIIWCLNKWNSNVIVFVGFMEWQTDKASMLDEIIDYVKFLQLQVKVLYSFLLSLFLHFYIGKRCFLVDNFGWQNNLLKLVAEYVTLCHSHGVFCVWTQVLSMSRLGGAPLVADMSSEVHYLLPFSFAFTSNNWNIKTHQHWYHKKGV